MSKMHYNITDIILYDRITDINKLWGNYNTLIFVR